MQEKPKTQYSPDPVSEVCLYRLFLTSKLFNLMPGFSPLPVFCYQECQTWDIHRVLKITDLEITTRCPNNHEIIFKVPFPDKILADTGFGVLPPELREAELPFGRLKLRITR